jgi:hypothetical protein
MEVVLAPIPELHAPAIIIGLPPPTLANPESIAARIASLLSVVRSPLPSEISNILLKKSSNPPAKNAMIFS